MRLLQDWRLEERWTHASRPWHHNENMASALPLIDRQMAMTLTVFQCSVGCSPFESTSHVALWRAGFGASPALDPRPSVLAAFFSRPGAQSPGTLAWLLEARSQFVVATESCGLCSTTLGAEVTQHLFETWDEIPFSEGRADVCCAGITSADDGTTVECYGLADGQPFALCYSILYGQRVEGGAARPWSRWVRALLEAGGVPASSLLSRDLCRGLPAI